MGKRGQENGPKEDKDKTESATRLGIRTRQEISNFLPRTVSKTALLARNVHFENFA